MNRLVIIGNGFDLAHGLKTSYQNFINWYWNQWGMRLLTASTYRESDGLCSFELMNRVNGHYSTWFQFLQCHYITKDDPFQPWDGNKVVEQIKQNKYCNFQYTSRFLERIDQNIETKGWVDIENEYYHLLVHVEERGCSYQELNNHLDILREKLIGYLQTVENTEIQIIPEIKDKIYRPFDMNELSIDYSYLPEEECSLSNIMLLNFNYTKTPEMYLKDKTTINYIHGKLDNPESVIFGYGDELDEDYKRLKNYNDNECLRHMKSIRYLDAGNYRNMLQFIEAGPFQVCIMGHSCGNSDRTLLNTIFEHRNCVSVKPYYYIKDNGEDNYMDLSINISRNFNDMKLMRDRVVAKPYTEPLVSK